MPEDSLQPVDSEKRPCAYHPQEETRLRCTECAIPICPKCMVMYEVGFKCKKCAKKRPSHMEQVVFWQYLVAGLLALAVGQLYGWVHPRLMHMGLFTLFGLPVLGFVIAYGLGLGAGSAIQRCIRYKSNPLLTMVAVCAVVVGLLLSAPIQAAGQECLQIISTLQDSGLAESSVAFYLLGRGLELLGPVFFIRGMLNRLKRPL